MKASSPVSSFVTEKASNPGADLRRIPRAVWFTLSLAALIIPAFIAFSQSPRSPAEQAAASVGTRAWLFYPVEENPPLPRIESDLNAVYALDEQRIWAVGNLGLIVHSEDGGRTWTQQHVSTDRPQLELTGSPAQSTGNASNENSYDASPKLSPGATNSSANSAPSPRPPNVMTRHHAPSRRVVPARKSAKGSNVNRALGKQAHAVMPYTPAPVAQGGVDQKTVKMPSKGKKGVDDNNAPNAPAPSGDSQATPKATPFKPQQQTLSKPFAPTPTPTSRRSSRGNASRPAATPRPVTASTPTPQPSSTPTASPTVSPSPQASATTEDLVAVIFNGAQLGFTAGRNGTLYATADGGQHWYVTASKLPAEGAFLEERARPGSASAPASAPFRIKGRWYRLTNDGQIKLLPISPLIFEWYERNFNRTREERDYDDLFVADMRVLAADNRDMPQIMVGEGGKICVSSSDKDCEPVASGTDKDLRAIEFVGSANAAWIVGDGGTILHSRDGGQTWKRQACHVQERLSGVDFAPDARHGWAVGYNGILATSDGGEHWVREAIGPHEELPAGAYSCSLPRWYYASWALAGLFLLPVLRRPVDVPPPDESVADVLVSDRPLEAGDPDPLHFQTIALGLSRFLRNEKTLPPLTIAITGEWGTGKSSLMNLLRADLRQYGFRPVWFNAWHHQKEEHLLASLLQNIRLQAIPRIWRPVGLMFRVRLLLIRGWRHWMPVLLLLFVAALLAGYAVARFREGGTDPDSLVALIRSFFNFKPDDISQTAPRLALLASVVSVLVASWKGVTAFGVNPASLLATVSSSMRLRDLDAQTCFRKKFADEFSDVTYALGQRSMIIFIDDLDRCRPENVLDTLEAVNFLVSSGDCFVVIGMARDRVERCVGLSFKDVAEEVLDSTVCAQPEGGTSDEARQKRAYFARQYLDKLINIEVPVPLPTADQSRELLIAADAPPPPQLLRRWQQAQAIFARLWPIAVASLILCAGVYAGLSLHRRFQGSSGEKSNALTTAANTTPNTDTTQNTTATTPEDDSTTNPGSGSAAPTPGFTPAPTPDESELRKQTQAASLTAATPARRPLASYWPLPLALLGLLGVAVWLLTRRPDLVVKDSEEFEKALRIWHPLVFNKYKTPRSLKRFMNRVRYLAMRERPQKESQTLWERLAAPLARRFGIELPPAADGEATQPRIPESALVALAAIQQFVPGWLENEQHFQQRIINNLMPAGYDADALTLLREAKKAHEQSFDYWSSIQAYRESFLKMSADIRVN